MLEKTDLRILIYHSGTSAVKRMIGQLKFYGFRSAAGITDFAALGETVERLAPQVLVVDGDETDNDLSGFLQDLRSKTDIPVIIWSKAPVNQSLHQLDRLRHIYFLNSRDGLFFLAEILQRIQQKLERPMEWI